MDVLSNLFHDLSDSDPQVRFKVASLIAEAETQLANLNSGPPHPFVPTSMLRNSSILVAHTRLSVKRFLHEIEGGISPVQSEVDELTLKVLLALLDTPYPPFREVVVQALGDVGDASIFDQISALVEDDDAHVRNAAIEALIQINPNRALSFLISLLTEHSSLICLLILSKLYLYTFDDELQAYGGTRFMSADLAPFRDKIAALTEDADVAVRESAMRLLHEMDNAIRA